MPASRVLARATAIGYFPEDDGGVLAVAAPERLYRVLRARWIWATGGYPVNLPFADNDRPGVIAARAVGRLLVDHGILARRQGLHRRGPRGRRRDATRWRTRSPAPAPRSRASRSTTSRGTRGRSWVSAVDTKRGKLDCDLVAVAATPAPASEGPRQQGCRVVLDPRRGGFRVVVDEHGQTTAPDVWACGDVTGYVGPEARGRTRRARRRQRRRIVR